MIGVQHLVIEALQRTLGQDDQFYRKVEVGKPQRGLDDVAMMFDIAKNVRALADAPDSGYQTYGVIWLDIMANRRFGVWLAWHIKILQSPADPQLLYQARATPPAGNVELTDLRQYLQQFPGSKVDYCWL
jgi:hypothetical protein